MWYNIDTEGERSPKSKETRYKRMFAVERCVDGQWCFWGRYESEERAREVAAMFQVEYGFAARVREERG